MYLKKIKHGKILSNFDDCFNFYPESIIKISDFYVTLWRK
jgi:hypothetical protein